jgi:hypothetical protein
MLSSVLNPSSIVNEKKTSPESFQKFMTGEESPLGSSVISSASNKIVGFSRVGVSPVTPDINSLLSDISTNIISNVDNSIKNTTNFITSDVDKKIDGLRSEIYGRLVDIESSINDLQSETYAAVSRVRDQAIQSPTAQAVSPVSDMPQIIENIQVQAQQTLNTTLSNFSKDYQEKIKGIQDTKPKNVLEKFLQLYKNAIGFISFFSDAKNINRLSENLKAIRNIFDNTFNVAKVLRETIFKIVKQLSNLPTASARAGGLDLNVQVPGGKLKQSAGPGASRMGKALKMGALGLGAVGLGVAGAEAAKRFQEQELYKQPETEGQDLPTTFIEVFSSIVDKFESVVNSLLSGSKQSPTGPAGGSGGGGGAPASPPAPPGGGGGSLIPGDAPPEIKALMETISGGEGGPNSVQGIGEVKGLSDMTIDQAISTAKSHIGRGSKTGALGAYQFHSEFLRGRAIDAGFDPAKDKFNLENQTKIMRHFQTVVYGGSEEKLIESLRSGGLESDVFPKLSRNLGWPSLPGGGQPNVHTPGSAKRYSENLKKYQTMSPLTQTPTQVSAAPTQATTQQQIARQVAQPAQNMPSLVSLPPTIINAAPPQQETSGGSNVPPPPSGSGGSIEVPFLPTSNPNNFYVLYSRSVYNIVDG